jgi:hypothetical protein
LTRWAYYEYDERCCATILKKLLHVTQLGKSLSETICAKANTRSNSCERCCATILKKTATCNDRSRNMTTLDLLFSRKLHISKRVRSSYPLEQPNPKLAILDQQKNHTRINKKSCKSRRGPLDLPTS